MNERRTEHKQMVVLDLNGTLLWRGPRKDDRSRNAYPRPHLGELLQFLADNFAVMVWSSAQPDSVHEMMTKILAPHYQQFVRVWDRRYCDLDGEYFSKAKTVKDLNRICNGFSLEDSPNRDVYKTYNGYKGACVDTKDRWTLENMLIVDDSESKTELQKDNHIFVSTFESPIERKSAGLPPDDELLKLKHYLELYTRQKDTYPNLLAYLTAHPWIAFRDASSDNRKQQSQ
ncbi:hypothetical protein GGF46_003550 [Coemansia sp. RSA 552]|nr:hypothetical protein GGF46_003550 [Coemansia sp. RSA 552]